MSTMEIAIEENVFPGDDSSVYADNDGEIDHDTFIDNTLVLVISPHINTI